MWALAKIKESFDVFGKEDTVESYLLFSNPHQYGKSIDIRFTPIRVVCNNTLTFSLNSHAERSVKVGHRTVFNADDVKTTLGLASEKFTQYKDMAQFLGGRRFTADSLIQYYSQVFPSTSRKDIETTVAKKEDLSRNAQTAYDMLEIQPGAEFGAGTWWQAFNSVTYVTDHLQGRGAENRLHNQWFGNNRLRKIKAANLAVQMATAA